MSKLTNKIEAHDRTVSGVLENKKYTVDYFQREYNWQRRHMEQLITDLTTSFTNEYQEGDERTEGENYNNYYLGPFVVSEKNGQRSIIDGQQRLTSLTLLLIYLNNLQKEVGLTESIESMIFSEHRGMKSFNIQVEERMRCFEQLFTTGSYVKREDDDASTLNMADRYSDIAEVFPGEIKERCLPFFIDWLKYNVVLVEIIAYSDDNAYTIFETMNDRGLNLTPTEMLKGYILSRIVQDKTRSKANEEWKKAMRSLGEHEKDEDQRFFQAWLRASFADTIRPGSAGSQNEDFEKIGTRFHSWVRENLKKMNLDPERSEDFERYVFEDFKFYRNAYLRVLKAQYTLTPELQHAYYIERWGIAPALSYPLMLAPLTATDTSEIADAKMDLVARFIEAFVVRRSINFRQFAASSIRYTMYSLVKEIRGKDLSQLRSILAAKVNELDAKWDGFAKFALHGMNKKFVKFLLARITAYVENGAGMTSTFQTYFESPGGKPFEVEHLWGNDFEAHADEFTDKQDFSDWRNSFGALVLLPNGTNQSYGGKSFQEKISHYQKENLLVSSLTPLAYQNNPNFTNWVASQQFKFMPHPNFKKADIEARQALYQQICEKIWDFPAALSHFS
ncbi:MAG TPA: DUF262 domain-containing protein [Prosthecobacter sp.]|nr:DUF262 domain-containing protein [Prosthecobacter sp.]